MGLVLEKQVLEEQVLEEQVLEEEQVEPKAFQVQEDAEEALEEAKEGHVDQEPDRQLEDLQVDWDTEGKKFRLHKKHPNVLYQHTMAAGARPWPRP